ncbi:hypothetical protein HMPREF2132_12300 [Prevotella histicola JCM 15637 = DNF00424]|uniref:Uncharacterized protein n=2 Tax=Prevotella histicola TaxID=470565 RepID=A0AAW3FDC2_9BACT|nr:hypothetical protein HMPREF2132_12300 [Prevotella histicola JCM 15637 = DNF00424]
MKPNETKSLKVCYLKPMMEILLVDHCPLMDNSPIEGDHENSNIGTGPEPLDAKPVPLFELDTVNLWDKWEE